MGSKKYTWTESVRIIQEDQALTELIKDNGEKKWCKVAALFNEKFEGSEKTGKQCRERWHNHLNPELKKDSFTLEEEIKVFQLQSQHGNKWSVIAESFEGRNDNFIKNCFYSAIRRNLRKYNKKKVPSKQLKGTISSLMKNPQTRKILMNFPEHERQERQEKQVAKPEVIKEEDAKHERPKEKEQVVKPQLIKPEMKEFRMKVAGRPEMVLKTSTLNPFTQKNIDDITPTLVAYMSTGLVSDDVDIMLEGMQSMTPIELNRIDSAKTDSSASYKLTLPDYSLQNSFTHYFSPRNSQ